MGSSVGLGIQDHYREGAQEGAEGTNDCSLALSLDLEKRRSAKIQPRYWHQDGFNDTSLAREQLKLLAGLITATSASKEQAPLGCE